MFADVFQVTDLYISVSCLWVFQNINCFADSNMHVCLCIQAAHSNDPSLPHDRFTSENFTKNTEMRNPLVHLRSCYPRNYQQSDITKNNV